MKIEHICDDRLNTKVKGFYGSAIAMIERIDGVWVAHNDEYYTPINFCPFCGVELKTLDKIENVEGKE